MSFKHALWYRIAIGVIVINLAGGVYAYLTSEPFHAFVHGTFVVGFGLWARYLKQSSDQSRLYADRQVDRPDKVELLEADLSELESKLRETQERLDFTEQLLKKKPPSS